MGKAVVVRLLFFSSQCLMPRNDDWPASHVLSFFFGFVLFEGLLDMIWCDNELNSCYSLRYNFCVRIQNQESRLTSVRLARRPNGDPKNPAATHSNERGSGSGEPVSFFLEGKQLRVECVPSPCARVFFDRKARLLSE